jgi:hypothetical protein
MHVGFSNNYHRNSQETRNRRNPQLFPSHAVSDVHRGLFFVLKRFREGRARLPLICRNSYVISSSLLTKRRQITTVAQPASIHGNTVQAEEELCTRKLNTTFLDTV